MNKSQSDKERGKAFFTEGTAVANNVKDKAEASGSAHRKECEQRLMVSS